MPNFYPDFTSERWTLMELRRLDNVLVWQSGFRCPCPDCRDLTNMIGLRHRSHGYILKGSHGCRLCLWRTTQKHAFFVCMVCGK